MKSRNKTTEEVDPKVSTSTIAKGGGQMRYKVLFVIILAFLTFLLSTGCIKLNAPPVFSDIPNQNVSEGDTLELNLLDYASDPDGDPLSFTLLSGVGTITVSTYSYSPDYGASGTYQVEIETNDGRGGTANDSFLISINHLPLEPYNPNPINGATDVSINATLSWNCNDPDGDILTYDIYFGINMTPPLIASDISDTTYNPGELNGGETYYWKVIARDSHGGKKGSPLWSFKTTVFKWNFPTGYWIHSSPAIGNDGIIYIGSQDNYLYAINPDGTVKWTFATGDDVDSSPAIGVDGTIYVGSYDGYLYAISPGGTQTWKFPALGAINSSPAIGVDGTIYVGSLDKNLYAINSDGTKKWSFMTSAGIDSSPAIGVDGTIYVGSNDFKLYAISPDGTMMWSFTTGNLVHSSPAISSDGTIYVGSYDGKLYAISPDGSMEWAFTTSGPIYSSPAIGTDDTVYIGSLDGKLYAISPDGTAAWAFPTSAPIYSSPAIGADSTIYVGNNDGIFYAVNSDGTEKWRYELGPNVYSSPVVGNDSAIYVGSGYFLCALKGNSGGPANAPWPMFHRDAKHTGMVPIP